MYSFYYVFCFDPPLPIIIIYMFFSKFVLSVSHLDLRANFILNCRESFVLKHLSTNQAIKLHLEENYGISSSFRMSCLRNFILHLTLKFYRIFRKSVYQLLLCLECMFHQRIYYKKQSLHLIFVHKIKHLLLIYA